MFHRKFYSYDEAAEILGDREIVRQAMLVDELPAFIELHERQINVHARAGKFPPDGANGNARWCNETFPFDDPPKGAQVYSLNGWFRLGQMAVEAFARANVNSGHWSIIADTDGGGTISFYLDINFREMLIWLRADDVERLAAPALPPTNGSNDKPLDARERTTLLRVIRALDAMAELPERGAPSSIEKQLQVLGFDGPKDSAIRAAIDEARKLEPDRNPQ